MSNRFFEQVIGKIFGKQSSSEAFIHEILDRSEKELEEFAQWQLSNEKVRVLKEVKEAYLLKQKQLPSAIDVHVLETQYSNGFAISYHPKFANGGFRNMFDYFKEVVLANGYKLSQADRRILDKVDYEQTVEKWYLKPQTLDAGAQMTNQRFGNVLIEKVDIDRKPSYIKLMANIYQDRMFTKAEPFNQLFQLIFKS